LSEVVFIRQNQASRHAGAIIMIINFRDFGRKMWRFSAKNVAIFGEKFGDFR
jgi:hypothetical protein